MEDTQPTPHKKGHRSGGSGAARDALPASIGRYVVLGELGRGGMGVVYLARDTRLDRLVALKSLPASLASSAASRERFEREARLLAALEHPHVGALYGIEESGGHSFLVLQRIEGATLSERLRQGALPLDEALDVARQVASGLAAAHRRGVVHCDLKPGNVMLTPDGTAKIVDFGVATRFRRDEGDAALEDAGDPDVIHGTPQYMSPEQVRGEELDPRTDVWSFGCLLAECLAGRPLFDGTDAEDVLRNVCDAEPDWSLLPASLPTGMRDVLASCLAKDRALRAADLELVQRRLEDVRSGTAPRLARGGASALPRALTRFVGREPELAEVTSLLGSARLLTLTGAAGCGKTRLALEAAARAGASFPDGTWLVELAPVSDEAHVERAVADAIGVREEPSRPVLQPVLDCLRGRKALLILDNCEHLLDAVSPLAQAVLRECPGLTLLCTSREALGMPGEASWRVPSLAHPRAYLGDDPGELREHDGIRLFLERAVEARPGFALDAENAEAVVALVARLDGIPLALELAAARLKALSPAQVVERLSDRFRLLTGGSRTSLERHQTLRGALDWSYDLLGADEQRCLRELSVFAGGFRLEEACKVCTGDEFEILDRVTSLVNKSLVHAELEPRKAPRYRLLESVRQHAAAKLDTAGEAAAARTRHRDCFLELVLGTGPAEGRARSTSWLRRMGVERDNVRAALEWTLSDPAGGVLALRMVLALVDYWDSVAAWREGTEHLRRFMETRDLALDAATRASLLRARSRMEWWLGDIAAAGALAEQARAIYEEIGDRTSAAATLVTIAMTRHGQGDLRGARAGYQAAWEAASDLGNLGHMENAALNLCIICRDLGEPDEAQRFGEQALELGRANGDDSRRGATLRALGMLAWDRGDTEQAWTLVSEGLRFHEHRDEQREVAAASLQLGHVARQRGDSALARELYRRSERASRSAGNQRVLVMALANLGVLHHDEGESDAAWLANREAARIALDLRFDALLTGVLGQSAWLLFLRGRAEEAALVAGAVGAAREQTGRRLAGLEAREEAERAERIRAALGDETFAAETARGAAAGLHATARELLAHD